MSTTLNDPTAPAGNTCAEIAANLRDLADRIDTLNWHDDSPYFRVSWLPSHSEDPYDERVARVEAIAQAVFDRPASMEQTVSQYGTHQIKTQGSVGRLDFSAHQTLTPPAEKSKDDELAELRAQLADAQRALQAATALPDDAMADHITSDPAERDRQPGDRVQIMDRDRDPARYEYATIVRAETKGGVYEGQPGYVFRYDDGYGEVWRPAYYVLDPRPASADAR